MMNFNFLFVLLCLTSAAFSQEICKPSLSIYFDSNSSELQKENKASLSNLIKNLDTENEYIIQLICSTDSIGSVSSNYKLAQNRGNSVEQIFRKSNFKIGNINIINKDERDPGFNNSTEINQRKNRRVDIVIFLVEDGNITLLGNSGTKIIISKDYFSPCSICESNPRIIEILNSDQAEEKGIPLITADGMELITGGMVQIEFDCPEKRKDTCFSAIVEFPIDTLAKTDSTMGFWESISTSNGIRWQRIPNRKCVPMNKVLITKIDCFQNATSSIPKYNCDILKCRTKIITPHLQRKLSNNFIKNDSSLIITYGTCPDSTFTITDIGGLSKNKFACYGGSISPFMIDKHVSSIPLSAYIIFDFPDLIRKNTSPYFNYDEKTSSIRIIDTITDTYNIEYSLDQTILSDDIKKYQSNNKIDSIGIESYSKKLFFYDSVYVVRSPKSLTKNIQLIIPPIDSVLTIDHNKKKSNIYQFDLPKHPVGLLLTLKNSNSDKKIELKLDSDIIRSKYKKKRRYHKLKIKKTALKRRLKK